MLLAGGFILMLLGVLLILKSFWVAIILLFAGAILFQKGLDASEKESNPQADQNLSTGTITQEEELENTALNAVQESKERDAYLRLNIPFPESAKNITSDPLRTAKRWGITSKTIYKNCPLVYKYPNIPVTQVDRDMLRRMVIAKEYEMTVVLAEDGSVDLYRGEICIARLVEKVEMCKDWFRKGEPIRCEFASFNEGAEKVALFFYRNEEEALKNYKCDIVRLTSCFSNSKQEVIYFLEKGEKLFIDTDDNDKPYLRNIDYAPIGNLAAKYNQAYEDDLIRGIYFDHSEKKESEDFDKDDKEIPYVRVYISE